MVFWKSKPSNKHTLSDIMRGMQHSVNTAQEILAKHYVNLMEKFFDDEGKPVTRTVFLPDNRSIEVPVISLMNQHSLYVDELEIDFKAQINGVALKNLREGKEDVDRASFAIDFTPSDRSDNAVSVKIKFKSCQKPEGVSRIVDEFDKTILPVDNLPDEPESDENQTDS
ncbi:uncharacterized protein DUF2589 [Natronoflexus pectinivorans]|uniref:Uncharacterized protein DUF2589 n=2 Tax=Natronoflexus pectinivorans TaxID=682526 RepID=A0A4R2GLH0_9BACT|nr:uncharacterized protein DUF2589 [Natronoflexus pectinivorans]